MPDPDKYERDFSFEGFQSGNPTSSQPGIRIDDELDNVALAINGVVSAVKDVRRSDGKLPNGIVGIDALALPLRKLLGAPPGEGTVPGLDPGFFGGVQGTVKVPSNPDNQAGFLDQKATSYEALSVDVGGYGPSRFGSGQNGAATLGLPQALCGKMSVPANSTMDAHAIGVGGWVKNYSPGSKTFAVGVYADARAMATGACTWGFKSVSADMGFSTPLFYGYECGVNVDNPNTTALGVDIAGRSTVAPNVNSSALHIQALGVQPPGGAAKIPWPRAINIRAASCTTAIQIDAAAETANSGTPPILFFANNEANVPYEAARLQVTGGGDLTLASTGPGKVFKIQTSVGLTRQNNITLYQDKVGIGLSGLPTFALDVGGSLRVGGGFAMAGGAPVGKQSITGNITGDIEGIRATVSSIVAALISFNMVNNNTN